MKIHHEKIQKFIFFTLLTASYVCIAGLILCAIYLFLRS